MDASALIQDTGGLLVIGGAIVEGARWASQRRVQRAIRFRLVRFTEGSWLLRNMSEHVSAADVRATVLFVNGSPTNLPNGVALGPGQFHEIFVLLAPQQLPRGELEVTWSERGKTRKAVVPFEP